MNVNNILNIVRDNRYQQRPTPPRGIMIHRVGVNDHYGIVLGYDAVSICAHFTGRDHTYPDVAEATGGQLPYTFMIGGGRGDPYLDGNIWQCLPLSETGWHARKKSSEYIGIACIGDFRSVPPSPSQLARAVSLTWRLCAYYGIPSNRVMGHGEIAGTHNGSKAPGESNACPGDLFRMSAFRSEVETQLSGFRSGLISSIVETA